VKKHAPRDRTRPLYVYVNGAERSEINAKAKAAGMTISAYLRAAATNKRILSALDREGLGILSQVHGDQGRLGGLLRMYLKDPDAAGSIARALLDQIKSVQRDLAEAAKKVR
jgi:hypothetical protein